MRVLSGIVYMTKSWGPRTEPWGTPQRQIWCSDDGYWSLCCRWPVTVQASSQQRTSRAPAAAAWQDYQLL